MLPSVGEPVPQVSLFDSCSSTQSAKEKATRLPSLSVFLSQAVAPAKFLLWNGFWNWGKATFAYADTSTAACCSVNFLPNIIFHISLRLCQLLSLHAGLLERYDGMSGLGWQCILDIFLSSVSPAESKSELSSQSHPVKSLLHAKYVEFLPEELLLSGLQLEVGKSDLWPCRVLQLATRTESAISAPVFTARTQQTSGVHGPSAAKLLLTAIRLFPICVNGL